MPDSPQVLAVLLAGVLACSPGAPQDRRPHTTRSGDSAATSQAQTADPWAVRLDGIGPLRYGMSAADVRATLRDTLGSLPPSDQCVVMVPATVPIGLRLMLEHGRLVRADVDSAGIRTALGAEVGMSEADLRTRYPSGLEQRPHKYDPTARYLIYRAPDDSSRRLVFETDRNRVLRYRGGTMPAVEYVEGCG